VTDRRDQTWNRRDQTWIQSGVTDLWRLYAADVWAFAARRVGRSAADDVVSRTFIVVCRQWSGVKVRKPRAWLLGIARNVISDELRSAGRQQRLREKLATQPISPEWPPEHVNLVDPELATAMSVLSPIDRELLCLIAWEELTVAEAAAVLGLHASTARMRLLRARRRLRSGLLSGDSSPESPRKRTQP
jgi:RNA polymerase sigma factor (sigma-70 family)